MLCHDVNTICCVVLLSTHADRQDVDMSVTVCLCVCSPKSDKSRVARTLANLFDRDATFVEYRAACARAIGMCGYTTVLDTGDRRTCLARSLLDSNKISVSLFLV